MSPFAEVQLVTARELRKSFRSVKGIVLAAVSIAGGAGVSMLFAWLDRVQRENLPAGIDAHDAQEQFFSRWYSPDTGKRLADCPYSLWMMLIATLSARAAARRAPRLRRRLRRAAAPDGALLDGPRPPQLVHAREVLRRVPLGARRDARHDRDRVGSDDRGQRPAARHRPALGHRVLRSCRSPSRRRGAASRRSSDRSRDRRCCRSCSSSPRSSDSGS